MYSNDQAAGVGSGSVAAGCSPAGASSFLARSEEPLDLASLGGEAVVPFPEATVFPSFPSLTSFPSLASFPSLESLVGGGGGIMCGGGVCFSFNSICRILDRSVGFPGFGPWTTVIPGFLS